MSSSHLEEAIIWLLEALISCTTEMNDGRFPINGNHFLVKLDKKFWDLGVGDAHLAILLLLFRNLFLFLDISDGFAFVNK